MPRRRNTESADPTAPAWCWTPDPARTWDEWAADVWAWMDTHAVGPEHASLVWDLLENQLHILLKTRGPHA